MPTARPRHTITETPRVAASLDIAARVWPEDAGNRSRLLLHLVETGTTKVEAVADAAAAERRAAAATIAARVEADVLLGDRAWQ